MKKIPLTKGQFTLVDDEDYSYLNQWKWFCEFHMYAVRDYRGKRMKMHRVIMDAPQGLEIDHIDGNGLNNQKQNLRIVTHAQNQKNMKKPITNTSGYKGVSWDQVRRKWVAYIWNGKSINLGGYSTKLEAAEAYDKAALSYFGDFAKTNRSLQ